VLYESPILSSSLQKVATLGAQFQLLSGEANSCGEGLVYKLHLKPTEREVVESSLRAVIREITVRRAGFEIVARARLVETLIAIERIASARQRGEPLPPVLEAGGPIAHAIAFMEDHFTDAIALDEIAAAAHLSPHYFCEVFKSAWEHRLGVTWHNSVSITPATCSQYRLQRE
jgi:hypothetical protein